MYYNNPYQPNPNGQQTPNYGYGQSYSSYQNFYAQPITQPVQQALRPDDTTAPTASTAATPTSIPPTNLDPIPWTNQPLARIYVRPQQYTAATSPEETLRMGTTFPELFRPARGNS